MKVILYLSTGDIESIKWLLNRPNTYALTECMAHEDRAKSVFNQIVKAYEKPKKAR